MTNTGRLTAAEITRVPVCRTTQDAEFTPTTVNDPVIGKVLSRIAGFMANTLEPNVYVSMTTVAATVTLIDACMYSFTVNWETGFIILKADCGTIEFRDLVVDVCEMLNASTTFFK